MASSKIVQFVFAAAMFPFVVSCSSGGGTATVVSGIAPVQNVLGMSASHHLLRHPRNVTPSGIVPRGGKPLAPFVNSVALADTTRKIAVSDDVNDVVNIFAADGTQLARLTGFTVPSGLASDIKGDLYVADTGNTRVRVYPPGLKGQPKNLAVPGGYPVGVDSFGSGAYVAVTTIYSTDGGPGSVVIYKAGVAGKTISSRAFAEDYFCAFDAVGDLFVDGSDANGNFVIGEIANATAGGTTLTTLSISNTIGFPGGVQVTSSGQIAVEDQRGHAIYTYDPPNGKSLGAPVATTTLADTDDPVSFAFTTDMNDLYTVDATHAQVKTFAYPAGGTSISSIETSGQPVGVALFPAQYPKLGP